MKGDRPQKPAPITYCGNAHLFEIIARRASQNIAIDFVVGKRFRELAKTLALHSFGDVAHAVPQLGVASSDELRVDLTMLRRPYKSMARRILIPNWSSLRSHWARSHLGKSRD